MNEYLTPMTEIIHQSRGTIDKYMGDAIMSFGELRWETRVTLKMRCRLPNIWSYWMSLMKNLKEKDGRAFK